MSRELEGFVTIGLVLVIYGVAEALGTYGLLATFDAGFTFRRYEFDHELHRPVLVSATAGPRFLDRGGRLFLGFFGVRGVAAPFYAAVGVDAGVLAAGEVRVVVWTTLVRVVVSIVVHGLSATPLTRRWLGGD